MTEKQREQLIEVEKVMASLSFGVISHTTNLKYLPKYKYKYLRTLGDCYAKPSYRKACAEFDILRLIVEINAFTDVYAHNYTVLSYNCSMFTCAFDVIDYNTGELLAKYYFTRTKSICFEF